nr:ORF2 [Torque teno felis virus]
MSCSCNTCLPRTILQHLHWKRIGLLRTTDERSTKQFGNKIALARIASGVNAVTGYLILSQNGLLPEMGSALEETTLPEEILEA